MVYWNSLESSFHFDDLAWIERNPSIRNIKDLETIWWFNPMRFTANLSFAVNLNFSGSQVFGFHLVNLAIHIFASFFVYLLCSLALNTEKVRSAIPRDRAVLISTFASIFFLAHPIQTQSVTYIVQRTTSLAGLFSVAAVAAYAKARSRNKNWIDIFYVLSLLSTILAMLTKESSFSLPFLVLLYEIIFLSQKQENGRLKVNVKALLPFSITLFIIPTLRLIKTILSGNPISKTVLETHLISPYEYLLTQLNVVMVYLKLLILPVGQSLEYDFPISHSLFEIPTILSFCFLVLFVFAICRYLRKQSFLLFCTVWFFISISVESSIIPIADVIFEHRLYLGLTGYAMMLPYVLYLLFRDKKKFTAACFIITVIFSVLTHYRNEVWASDISLYEDSVRKAPNNPRALLNLGIAHLRNGNNTRSFSLFNRALEAIKTGGQFEDLLPNVYLAFGSFYLDNNDKVRAIEFLNKAVELQPNHFRAWTFLGIAHMKLNQFDKALQAYKQALAINDQDPFIHMNISNLYQSIGDSKKAKEHFKKMAELYKIDEESINRLLNQIDFAQKK